MRDWKARMHPKIARSEILLFQALQRAGLNKHMTTQQPIPLTNELGEPFQTIPDFTFYREDCDLALYLDGPHHLKAHVEERDIKITKLLEQKGIQVKRISYDGHKLKPPELLAIVNEIHAWLHIN
jgi:very-short-patch-repair endonuclease